MSKKLKISPEMQEQIDNNEKVKIPYDNVMSLVGDKRFKRSKLREIKYKSEPYPKNDNKHYKIGDSKKEIVFRKE